MTAVSTRGGYDRAKRAIDIAVAGIGILLTWPIQLLIAALIRIKMGGPVLFRQNRPGLNGQVFELIKFRTMRNENPARGLVDDADRLTSFGRFLRSTSMDELPTLLNVLRGDMSLVGPRPLLVSYLERYSPEQNKRHQVRPGITGLAQARGRNALAWEEKFALDVYYVEHRSLVLDIKILLETVQAVITRRGITAHGSASMPEFQGSSRSEQKGEA
jgi:lipopolysaccharide/colanic/teichoic acid biosynthesis glycosyltransferase